VIVSSSLACACAQHPEVDHIDGLRGEQTKTNNRFLTKKRPPVHPPLPAPAPRVRPPQNNYTKKSVLQRVLAAPGASSVVSQVQIQKAGGGQEQHNNSISIREYHTWADVSPLCRALASSLSLFSTPFSFFFKRQKSTKKNKPSPSRRTPPSQPPPRHYQRYPYHRTPPLPRPSTAA